MEKNKITKGLQEALVAERKKRQLAEAKLKNLVKELQDLLKKYE